MGSGKIVILFKELNLPHIPGELLVFKTEPDKVVGDTGYKHTHVKDGRILNPCGYIGRVADHQPLLEWLQANIPGITPSHRVLKQISKPFEAESTHIVHTDVNRKFALNYFLNLGGTGVITSWYQERGEPINRPTKTMVAQSSDTGTIEYENLIKLCSTQFKARTWYLMATDVLHDVDHITDFRVSITINLKDRTILKDLGIEDV